MRLFAFGINHKTAPVDVREQVAFAPERLKEALKSLKSQPHITEAAILSTCNRTELYCCVNGSGSPDPIQSWFLDYHHLLDEKINPYVYIHPDRDAVRHLLRVASGLDSLVLGEPQILGQVKSAYREASEAGTLGTILNKLCQHTFNVAKQVRTDTAIGESPVSVAFAAVSLSKQFFSDFSKHTALMIGAGETIELAARHLKENGIGNIIIANRTVERGEELAREVGGFAIALGEIPEHLHKADILISSTASQLPILGKGTAERAIKARKRRPMLMVDIAVPRDIEPEVADLADVYLYTVDDLQDIIEEGLKSRQDAAQQAEDIIDTQVLKFMGWIRSQGSVDLIKQFRSQMEQLREQELEKSLKALSKPNANPEEVLKRLAHNLTNKLTHGPTTRLREAGTENRTEVLQVAAEIFDLKNSNDKP
ncbi:MAG: glutamyl-tRNA reductase [Gammaproteobacteria bacterium]|nr:glutamyl-tRNA reductase [Gammaproteobacteria bacterium]